MRRQTRLTPAEGGRFAGPVGSPVPSNAADMGLSTDEQEKAANSTVRQLEEMLFEHGCEMLGASGLFQWIIIKGDRVLMRVPAVQIQLARLEETRAIVEEVVRREAASAEDTLEMLDDARNSERLVQAELDMVKRAALGDSEMIEHLRDQNAALVKEAQDARVQRDVLAAWKAHRFACDKRAHDYDLDTGQCRYCHVQLSDEAWTVMREATGRAAPRKRKEVGRLEDITGGPATRVHMLGGVPFISSDEIPEGRTIYAVPRNLMEQAEQTRRESREVLQCAFDHAYPKKTRVLEDGRHLIDKAEAVMIGGMEFTMPVRGFYDVSIRLGRPYVHIHEEEEG